MCPLFVLCTFFVHTPLASFASQYYLKVFLLNICTPTLDNALHLPYMVYYISQSDLLSCNPLLFHSLTCGWHCLQMFLAASTESVRYLRLVVFELPHSHLVFSINTPRMPPHTRSRGCEGACICHGYLHSEWTIAKLLQPIAEFWTGLTNNWSQRLCVPWALFLWSLPPKPLPCPSSSVVHLTFLDVLNSILYLLPYFQMTFSSTMTAMSPL